MTTLEHQRALTLERMRQAAYDRRDRFLFKLGAALIASVILILAGLGFAAYCIVEHFTR